MTAIALGVACLLAGAGPLSAPAQAQVPDPSTPTASGLPLPALVTEAPETIALGEQARIRLTVDGAETTGEIAILEVLDGETWTATDSDRVAADETASFTTTPEEPESYTFRVRLPATTRHRAASSEPFAVRVTAATGPAPLTAAPARGLCGGDDDPQRPDGRRWVCTYDDEFDGTTLDRRYWVPQRSSAAKLATGTSTQPSCFTDSPDTIAVRDGDLVLSALALDTPVSCGGGQASLVSGMVSHLGTFAQTYGRFEVRAKVPSWSGKGLQETFWLWPVDQLKYGVQHPASGEIDFGEFYSNYAYLNVPVIHYLFDPYTISYATNTNIYTAHKCFIRAGEYNTYTLLWEPGRLTIQVNGTLCLVDNYIATNAPADHPNAPFDSPFYLALTQAFGASGNEYDPAVAPHASSTRVDYVRIWN
ncbi:MAG: family 16 glycosylhydrolase [Nocardioidaceae bacterium]|nr:family 16 glycosylhydrolase [Nocardioidaceae bacterium]